VAAIELRNVWKRYRLYRERYRSLKEIVIHRRFGEWEDRWVLQDASVSVEPGTTLGLVGPNGAGKSTALKLMSRILSPDRGSVSVHGRVSGLIELGAGFQPEYTGRENIFLNASLLGLRGSEIRRRFDDIVDFSELAEHIDSPLRTYSSGMYMRLGFSVAINVQPEILMVDEILAVGDEAFQRKCRDWLEDFQHQGGTLVMVSHNLGAIRDMCDRAMWIGNGRVLGQGDAESVVDAYLGDVHDRGLEGGGGRAALHDGALPAVEIGEVQLLDKDGRPVDAIRSGEPLSVEIAFRVNRLLDTPVFGVALHRNDGAYVYGSNTHVDGYSLPSLESDGRITLTYAALPLLSGTYLVTVAVFDSEVEGAPAIDFREDYYRIRVVSRSREQGLTRLNHDWHLDPPAGQERSVG
jgi:ABC-type polysaccharide/polyol phosphate transport system ATPase subunit